MGKLAGLLYCCFWGLSIIAGYLGLYCPLLPLILVSNKLYRYATDGLFTFWQLYPTVLVEVLCGCRVLVTGDPVAVRETSVLIMNHRTRTDWNFLWAAFYYATGAQGPSKLLHPLKFVLKDAIRHIPGPGWVMQLACFVYIKRNWLTDKLRLENLIEYFCRIKYKFSLLIFPEGTDLTVSTKRSSHHFAEKNKLKKYEHVLHPRTKGFIFLTHKLMTKNVLDCVYDVTLLYPDSVPQTEMNIAKGQFPKVVRMHFVRYEKSVLPKTEAGLKQFLEELWMKKEEILRDHSDNGNFFTGQLLRRHSSTELYLALVFWTLLPAVVGYTFLVSSAFRKLVALHTAFLLTLNLFSAGFSDFEICIYNLKRRLFTNPW